MGAAPFTVTFIDWFSDSFFASDSSDFGDGSPAVHRQSCGPNQYALFRHAYTTPGTYTPGYLYSGHLQTVGPAITVTP
jgi:hypothetical protein